MQIIYIERSDKVEENYITMIMPTFNHPTYIEYFINNAVIPYTGTLFRFEIHDSSTNNDTKNLIDEYNENHNVKIKYFRYESNINGDLKTYKALCQCDTAHLYLMGDGVCPDFNILENYLLKNEYYRYDYLGIEPYFFCERFKKYKLKNDQIYDEYDVGPFFSLFYHEFTFYGGSLCSKKIWDFVINHNLFEKFKCEDRFSFAYDLSIFEALSMNDFKYGMSFISFFKPNPLKKASTWIYGENYYKIGLCEIEHDISIMSSYYEKYKKSAIKKNRKVFWNIKVLLQNRLKGNVNFKLYKKYKKQLQECRSNCLIYFIVCLIPKLVLYSLKGCKRLIKKILRRG